MKSKIISILLLLIIAFSIVTLSGCWLFDNDSDDGDSSLDTDGSSGSKPARKYLMSSYFEDKLYRENEEIVLEVKLGILASKKQINDVYESLDEPINKEPYTKLYIAAYNDNSNFPKSEYEFLQRMEDSQLTVLYTIEEFCAENYPLGNGYNYDVEKLNSVQVKIPKELFVKNNNRVGIYAFVLGGCIGFDIYYKHQEDGIFISRKYINEALDNEE